MRRRRCGGGPCARAARAEPCPAPARMPTQPQAKPRVGPATHPEIRPPSEPETHPRRSRHTPNSHPTNLPPQAKIDDSADASPLAASLRTLNTLAKKLRERRRLAGALSLASPEVRFQLDDGGGGGESGEPTDMGVYQLKDTNAMVRPRSRRTRRAR